MSPRRDLRTEEHGFTLLELLVAITLLGLLMTVMFGGLRLGARVWETTDARLDASARLQVVQDFIRQRLTEALPPETAPLEVVPPQSSELGDVAPLFLGRLDSVRFAGVLPENLGAGVYLMELALAKSGHAKRTGDLVLRWRPFELNDEPVEEVEPEERVLIEDVEALELSYFGSSDPEQPPDWWQAWEGQPELPLLIRLRVRFADHDERRWTELIVRPMLDRAGLWGKATIGLPAQMA